MPFGKRLQDEQTERRVKSYLLSVFVTLCFMVLLLRLAHIQVVEAEDNIRLSNENSMRQKVIVPPRGRIFDRNGEVLARNRPSYSICVLPYKLRDRDSVISSLCRIRDMKGNAVFDSLELVKKIGEAFSRRFDATRIKEDVSIEVVSIVEEHSMDLPGIIVETESRREYPLREAAFHVVGYMGEIPEKEFDSLKTEDYFWGDLIGRAGLEREYESVMRGTCGREYLEVNAYGQSLGPIKDITRVEPSPGKDLYLTLHAGLQKAAAEAFPDSLKGTVVALDPRNGEVLVMFSNPSIDANIFSAASSVRSKTWAKAATDRSLPLNNRAVGGTYPPGSTFKPLSGIAALATGNVTRDMRMPVPCRGSYRFGTRVARCWKPSGHGNVNYVSAIKHSCNVYFYQLGIRVGDELINHYARMFCLGQKTGIDLPSEKEGYLSGEKAYNRRFASKGWRWTRGLVLDLAIGQQQIFTPLQLVLMTGGLGNGKAIYRPFLLKEERSSNGLVVRQNTPSVLSDLNVDEKSIQVTREALEAVVNPGGTGWRAAVSGIPVGGKTGSAQNPHGDLSHALFVGAAPVDDPVIAIAVVVENAGGGGAMAAPVAGEVLRYFFSETEEGKTIYKKYNPEAQTEGEKASAMKTVSESGSRR
ncbi:MAG: penicillin-binding protein 2 [Chitinispirillaceae bacterium]